MNFEIQDLKIMEEIKKLEISYGYEFDRVEDGKIYCYNCVEYENGEDEETDSYKPKEKK